MYFKELYGHHCALLGTNITLLVITFVKRYGNTVKHHPFSARYINWINEVSFSCREFFLSILIQALPLGAIFRGVSLVLFRHIFKSVFGVQSRAAIYAKEAIDH